MSCVCFTQGDWHRSKEAAISAVELEQDLQLEWKELLGRTARVINEARSGAIIADSEDIVRQAMAEFRQKVYERAVQLAADKAAKATSGLYTLLR